MKHILIVETPDTIPDPEFLIEARCAGTLDEREKVEFREVTLPDDDEIEKMLFEQHNFPPYFNEKSLSFKFYAYELEGAKWFKSLLQ